jgi:hypothetical protein
MSTPAAGTRDEANAFTRRSAVRARRLRQKDGKNMGSSGKKKTTMAKLARENRLRERRLNKQTKKDARRQATPDRLGAPESPLEARGAQSTPPDPTPAAFEQAVQPPATADHEEASDEATPGATGAEAADRPGAGGGPTIHSAMRT